MLLLFLLLHRQKHMEVADFGRFSASSMRFYLIRYLFWPAAPRLVHFAVRSQIHITPKWIQAPLGPGPINFAFFHTRGAAGLLG